MEYLTKELKTQSVQDKACDQFLCFALNKKVSIVLPRDKLESDSERKNIMFYPPNIF